jgi:hypothetical protein
LVVLVIADGAVTGNVSVKAFPAPTANADVKVTVHAGIGLVLAVKAGHVRVCPPLIVAPLL